MKLDGKLVLVLAKPTRASSTNQVEIEAIYLMPDEPNQISGIAGAFPNNTVVTIPAAYVQEAPNRK